MIHITKKHEGPYWSASHGIFLIILCTCLSMLILTACGKHKEAGLHPPIVEVAQVIQKDVPVYGEWVGTTDGFVNAVIRAQVQGYLIKQNYREGDVVRKGQVLFEIDPRLFEAALEQAKASLAGSEARWTAAKADLARVKPLAAQNAVSQKTLDDTISTEQSTHASVLSAKATVDKAALDLSFTKVTSLINGIAGIAKTQIGDLVGPGPQEELTTVSTVDPIKVYINISEQEYLYAAKTKDSDFEKRNLELILTDGTIYPHKGMFFLADRQIDVKTGTIKVGAIFKNPAHLLRPGQFAKVKVLITIRKGALLVPQRAVTELQGSYQVAVVGPDNKVDIRPVKATDRVDTFWVIDEGLKPGEHVIVEGIQKVKQGMPVTPKPFGAVAKTKPEGPAKAGTKPAAPSKAEKR
ncbi:MAG: efflux transporter periplasmic adaptor subunit [Syntrophus sp. (in: bacteria)]|nr:efflux transporter periplasmic adaptor subunit [Syntrophus sp. (in: bacteria)]